MGKQKAHLWDLAKLDHESEINQIKTNKNKKKNVTIRNKSKRCIN